MVVFSHRPRGLRFLGRIGNSHLREAVSQSISRKAQGSCGLALVAVRALDGFANNFFFPFFEGHTGWQNGNRGARIGGIVRGPIVEMKIGGIERGARGESHAALDTIFKFANVSRPVIIHQ